MTIVTTTTTEIPLEQDQLLGTGSRISIKDVRARFMNLNLHKGKYVKVTDVDRLRNEIIGILQNVSEASYKKSVDFDLVNEENQKLREELKLAQEQLENNDDVSSLEQKLNEKDIELYNFIADSNEKLDTLQRQYSEITKELANKNELIQKYEQERYVLAQAIKTLQNNK